MATTLSIDAYKRKQNVLAAKAHQRRAGVATGASSARLKESYAAEQRRYLNACVENHSDPDARLLAALREEKFVLKLDKFGPQELAFHMKFLQKTKRCKHISISLGSVAVNRDLRCKFDRLGVKKAYAFASQGAASVVRSACLSAYKTSSLLRFHVVGVQMSLEAISLLPKTLFQCRELEDISLNGSNLGDDGLEAIATALGKCPKLHMLSLAGCRLTDKSKDQIAKIITLHGVVKDEAVWSSSLRGEVAPNPVMPELLINLSRNDLGDESAETICDALITDKWLLGLNLGRNGLTPQGIEIFIDTLAKPNRTLAVFGLVNMKDPVPSSMLETLDSILRPRNRFLQQMATESREKRVALGALLLEWGVDKDTLVEICYLEPQTEEQHVQNGTQWASKKTALVSPSNQRGLCQPQLLKNRKHAHHDNNNSDVEDDDDEEVEEAPVAHGHVKTIEYLIERLSALEADKRKMQAYVNKVEAENRRLRAELEAQAKAAPSPGISAIEAQIIEQLETSISSLAEQVEYMEHEKQEQPFLHDESQSGL